MPRNSSSRAPAASAESTSRKISSRGTEARPKAAPDLVRQKKVREFPRDESARRTDGRMRAEQELEEFFAAAPLGLMWVDEKGRVVRANQVELELLDRPMEEVVGQLVTELHVDTASVAAVLERVARRETVRNYHLSVQSKEGAVRHLLVDANGRWEGRRLLHSRWFVRDITHRVKLECEILAIAEGERARIGRELHDGLCQQLVAIEYLNESLANEWAAVTPAVALAAREISAQLRGSIDYARELARGLTPSLEIEPHGLAVALQELAQRTQRIFKRTCCFTCAAPIAVRDRTMSVHLYRIVQEAVGNAVKHAQARRIDISLAANERDLILRVKDDGIGIPAEPPKEKGVGLRIIRYRVSAIGGSLTIQTGPGGGTSIVCTVKDALSPPV
jgi:PAS domain S-box-containing protein